jgi:uncharacterized cupredoxin-like copper-binding protein
LAVVIAELPHGRFPEAQQQVSPATWRSPQNLSILPWPYPDLMQIKALRPGSFSLQMSGHDNDVGPDMMETMMSKLATFVFAAMFAAPLVLAGTALADATINVSLWDNNSNPDMSKSMGMMMGSKMDMSKAPMAIKLDTAEVAAGKVTFAVKNDSKETIHEMLVSPVRDKDTMLPFVEADNKVNEEASGDLGEVSELDPGKSGSLTLDLKPGLYVLYCNVPGHYSAGMWTTITVK